MVSRGRTRENGCRPPGRAVRRATAGHVETITRKEDTLQIPRVTSRKNGLVVLVGVVGLLLSSAGPAAAQTVLEGAGAGIGYEYVGNPVLCGLPTSGAGYTHDKFVLDHTSEFTGVDDTTDIAVYAGPAQIKIELEPVTQAPQGSAPGICPGGPLAIVPAPTPIKNVTVSGNTPAVPGTLILPGQPAGSVSCTGYQQGTGTYTRVEQAVVFQFNVNCTVNGNVDPGTVNNVPTTFVVEGTQTPCFIPLPPFDENTPGVENPLCVGGPTDPDPLPGEPPGDPSSILTTAFEAVGATL